MRPGGVTRRRWRSTGVQSGPNAGPSGVATPVSYHDADEVFSRASLVRNTVEPDPDEPTLTEVREMIDEVMTEEPVEEATDL